jgi:excisionase family DNA binding protein
MSHREHPSDPAGQLLRPAEVAKAFGVATKTIAAWARAGRLPFVRTVGGHRRYRWADVRALIDAEAAQSVDPARAQLEEDAVRLYEQGWSIRQVAGAFGYGYGAMRRVLMRRTALRPRSARRE